MILPYEENPYRGVVIDETGLPDDTVEFAGRMAATVAELREKEYHLAWLRLPPAEAHLIAPSLARGFTYHHADGKEGVLLVLRINPAAEVPGYATHFIGVGGVVIDDRDRLLVIQEQHHRRRHWKLPGGAVDPAEHIADAAVREVYEETGIHAEFLSLHCFRHWHGYRYGKSDIYFVCRLRPVSDAITADPVEIAEARWIPVDEYLADPDTHPFNRKIVETSLAGPGLKIEAIPGYGSPETHEMMF